MFNELTQETLDLLADYMDDEIRETLHTELSPCSPSEFLKAYCKRDETMIDFLKQESWWIFN